MEWIHQAVDLFLHLDKHLNDAMIQHGTAWTYLVLFAIIFSETGFVVTPFLPGDSLLFAAGALAATPESPMSVGWLFVLLTLAAVGGNTTNYSVGRLFGDKLSVKFPRIIKPKYLAKTHAFYEKYGGETIIITRFVPIVRTFAPFVAGIGHMKYLKFTAYNVAGGVLWVAALLYGGYWFGGLRFVKEHFAIVELAIIFISILPMIIEFVRYRLETKTA
ncbi:MAG TPA: DedA family protein [Verrucomicrobiae bacterium]|nr:DedA family protein [Verrucomicrobiae bacterium]